MSRWSEAKASAVKCSTSIESHIFTTIMRRPWLFSGVILLWIVLKATSLVTATLLSDRDEEDACATTSQKNRYSALACWLQQLRIPLPKQSFREGIITLTLHDFVCSNFTVTGLESEFVSTAQSPLIEMNVRDVSVICQGAYKSSGGFTGKVQAILGARHEDTPAVHLVGTVLATPGNHSFVQPQALQTTQCATDMAVTDLHFSGSLSAHTIQLFAREIRSSVTKALSTKVCPLVSDTLEPMIDRYIAKLNQWLEPYLIDGNDDDETQAFQEPTVYTQPMLPQSIDVATQRLQGDFYDAGRQWKRNVDHPSAQLLSLHRHHKPKKEMIKWSRDAPALIGFLQRVNHGLRYFLKMGLLQHWLHDESSTRPRSCGFFFDGINSLMRSILYDNNGWMDIPLLTRWEHLYFVVPNYAAVRLQIQNVSLHGLDQWDALQLFAPLRGESFLTQLDAHNVTLRTRFHLALSAVPGGIFKGDDLEEDFIVDLNSTSLLTALEFHLNADKNVLQKKVTVGTLWDVFEGIWARNASLPHLSCLLESIDSFLVSDLSATWAIKSLSFQPAYNGKTVRSSLEEDVDRLINNAMQVIWSEFPEMVTQSIKGLARGPVITGLNAFFQRMTTTNQTCPASNHNKFVPHFIDFTNVAWLKHMNDFFARSSTKRHINAYLQCGAEYLTMALQERIPNSLFQIKELFFENLGHLREMHLLSSSPGSSALTNGFLFAGDNSSTPCLNAKVVAGLAEASAELNFTLRWNDIGALSSVAMQYDLGRLKQYPLTRVLEHGQCLLVPMTEFDVYDVSDHLGFLLVDFNVMMKYGKNNTVYINWTSAEIPEVQAVASSIWSWAVNVSRDFLSAGTISAISQAGTSCSGNKHSYNENSSEDYLSISLVICAIVLLAQPALLMIHADNGESAEVRRREEEQQQYEDALLEPLVSESEHSVTENFGWENIPKENLLENSKIPDTVRVAVPVLIVCTMVILLCSNVSVGAEVKLMASVAGETFEAPTLFSFSLYNTAKEMLQARIYSLLFLVIVFSGIWPYLKLALMLFGWLRRFTERNVKRRERMFFALDALGKFSLVDTYVLVLMVVAFRYHLELEKGVQLDVFVIPKFGFYGFLIGTITSLVLNHILVFYHRKAVVNIPDEICSSKSTLCRHAYQTDTGRKTLTMRARVGLLVAFVCTITLLAAGVTQESFIFEFGGVAGELIGTRKDVAYSLISLGTSLSESVENSGGLAIFGLQSAYLFFAAVSPFACLTFLFVIFVFPLSLKQQSALLTCAEIANAWSAIEVFCLSIVAALLEISTFASFIVGDKCELIDLILRNNFNEIADTCYSVSAGVSWNVSYLVVGVFLNSALVSFALRLAHTAMGEKLKDISVDRSRVDSLASREISFVERLDRWNGTSWILQPSFEFGAVSAVDDSEGVLS